MTAAISIVAREPYAIEGESEAGGRDDERPDAADEPDAAVIVIGITEGARDLANRPPPEYGGKDHEAVDDEGVHRSARRPR